MVVQNGEVKVATPPLRKEEGRSIPGQEAVSKVEALGWKMNGQPGEFMLLSKTILRIDHTYQRDNINNIRVLEIASDWWWISLGCLIVGRRSDGTFWVLDGQHRKLAADKRSDVDKLPCIVFDVESIAEEATGFVGSNTLRGPVSMYYRYRANIAKQDESALAIAQMVAETGHRITRGGGTKDGVSFVALLCREHARSEEVARRIWHLLVRIAAGQPVSGDLFGALCFIEHYMKKRNLGSLTDPRNAAALVKAGQDKLVQKMDQAVVLEGRGGDKTRAIGVLKQVNHGRQPVSRIPEFGSAITTPATSAPSEDF